MRDMYEDLVKNERIKLISTEEESFELIKHAKAVSTITGTVGWEAMVRRKPVIAFGLGWYENYSKGVLRITNEKSAKDMLNFIENYQYDEHSLLAYLAAVGKNTRLAYYFKYLYKNEVTLVDGESENNIVDAIKEQLDL
jgi:capsule polysaccharide export protein KpsC/LpsZ